MTVERVTVERVVENPTFPEPEPMTPSMAVPVPMGAAERPSPEALPREADAAPPPKSQGGDTPSRPDSPTTSGKSMPGTQNTNPERVSVMQRLDFFRAEIARRGAPQKEQSKGAEKGAANPVAGKGRAPDGQFPKSKALAKGAKIPKAKAPVR